MKTHLVHLELNELDLKRLHDWAEGLTSSSVNNIADKVALQVARSIPRGFYPSLGEWVYYQGLPAKIVGKTKGLDFKYILEQYESENSDKFDTVLAKQSEVHPYEK